MKGFIITLLVLLSPVHGKERFHVKGVKEDPQHSPLGFLNASGYFQVGKDDIRVKIVNKSGIASAGGLRSGDVIVAANGRKFEAATDKVDDGGKGPREGLGMAMDESLYRKDKALILTVVRGGKNIELTIALTGLQPLSKTYPYNCQRSAQTLAALADAVLKYQKPDGGFGGKTVQSATAALGLLATGDVKYLPAVKKAAYQLLTKPMENERFPAWAFIYGGTFLCEYYLATGDKKVLPRIKYISDALALEGTSEKGRHSHGIRTKAGYGGKGLNIISGHVLLVWGLARKCGIKIHEKPFLATLAHLKKCTKKTGGTGYMQAAGMSDASARTGLFTLALYINEIEPELQQIQGSYLAQHTRRMRECHTNALFGMIWGGAALNCINPEGFRTHMDYWRWYMHLGKTPAGHSLVRYYIPSKKNNGGDGYLKYDMYNHFAMTMVYAVSKKNLFVHGNKEKFWMKREFEKSLSTK